MTVVGAADLDRRHGKYGIDAPYVPLWMGAGAVVAIAVFIIASAISLPTVAALNIGLALAASVADYLYTSRVGKFAVWRELLLQLDLRGDERVLDLGCGRGAVLLMVAKLLPRGRAVGIDLWKSSDQSGNALEVTRRNAELERVADRVDVRTGDMRALPSEDDSFDVVLSSLAIHTSRTPPVARRRSTKRCGCSGGAAASSSRTSAGRASTKCNCRDAACPRSSDARWARGCGSADRGSRRLW